MSYDITDWRTKKLENLVIPLKAFYGHSRADWHPDLVILDVEKHTAELECGCGQSIKGVLNDNQLSVTEIDMTGEGSGAFRDYVLDDALEQSKGTLEAVLIWEGGDSITWLKVVDGELTEGDIEL